MPPHAGMYAVDFIGPGSGLFTFFVSGRFAVVQLSMQHDVQEVDARLACAHLMASESGETAA